jgi:hypothetical protein
MTIFRATSFADPARYPPDLPTTRQNPNRGAVTISPTGTTAQPLPVHAPPAAERLTLAAGTGAGQDLNKTFRHEPSRMRRQLRRKRLVPRAGAGQDLNKTFGHAPLTASEQILPARQEWRARSGHGLDRTSRHAPFR